jgi:hypothetical protein
MSTAPAIRVGVAVGVGVAVADGAVVGLESRVDIEEVVDVEDVEVVVDVEDVEVVVDVVDVVEARWGRTRKTRTFSPTATPDAPRGEPVSKYLVVGVVVTVTVRPRNPVSVKPVADTAVTVPSRK